MCKRFSLLGILMIVWLIPATVLAQGPAPQHSDPNWQAAYFNNMTLSGSPVLQRSEANINYNWGVGSPDPTVNGDGFSARWSRYLDLSGTYRFTTTSDDGLRLYVNGRLLINEWNDHPPKTVSADITLASGHHMVVVEYYENTGGAVAAVSWAPVTVITNWRGEYFNNTGLSGGPALVRDDAQINFLWGNGSPAPGMINGDQFSVRWTRSPNFDPGNYRFAMTIDDGGRLWVNGHLLIDAWRDQAARTYTGDIYLAGGAIPIKMEYYENTGVATAQLSWARTDGGPGPGIVIVDDGGPGFTKGGSPSAWHSAAEGYGGHLLWTKNNDYVRPNYNWAAWYPRLQARNYEVFVYIPYRYTTTAQARYWITHADGQTLRIVSQSANGDRWVSLGTYRFLGTSHDYVTLADVTFEPYLSRIIAFDAMKWEPR